MTEWLDIVDEQDNVIGRDTRARVHAAGQLHRSSHIVLFNSRGELFVQLRSLKKDYGGGLWDTSAAGHVNSGESYTQCAVRELKEELGIEVDPIALDTIGTLAPSEKNGFEFTTIFGVCSERPLILQKEEIDDGRWVKPASLERWIADSGDQFTEAFKAIWSIVSASTSGPGG